MSMLERHGGNEDAALQALSSLFLGEAQEGVEAEVPVVPAAPPAVEPNEADPLSDDEFLEVERPLQPGFDSGTARKAAADVFLSFLKPLLPKPQYNGSFKGGDVRLLDLLMPTPVTLALPRPERLADLIRPEGGWNEAALLRARSFFSLAAVNTEFLIYLPTITHRAELARSDLFKELDHDGATIGVRDCCPRCRSNRHVHVATPA